MLIVATWFQSRRFEYHFIKNLRSDSVGGVFLASFIYHYSIHNFMMTENNVLLGYKTFCQHHPFAPYGNNILYLQFKTKIKQNVFVFIYRQQFAWNQVCNVAPPLLSITYLDDFCSKLNVKECYFHLELRMGGLTYIHTCFICLLQVKLTNK